MYIATVPNRHSPPAILLRESFREGSKVRTRTLANLTSWAPERIEALRRALKGEFDGLSGDLPPTCGPIFAVLFVLKQLADRIGLTRVLGKERLAKLALFLVLVRIAAQGSRLSAVRWAANHAVAETLGLGHFDEDDLYAALDALAPRQAQIEETLYRVSRRQTGPSPTVVLYDVTSSYFEGECNELAAFGYNRDKKAGKAQIVIGLVTTGHGEPLAVQVFDGNTSDPLTVPAQVETLRRRFAITEVVFVGDRGMRLVLRQSEAVRRKAHRRRHDKLAKLHALIAARNAFVRTAKRAQPAAGLRTLQAWVTRHKLAGWVQLSLQENDLIVTVDEAAQIEASRFDGCYVLETDVPQTLLEAQAVHDRYRDLHEVEQDFRTMKTGLLEVRPIFVRKALCTRAHVLVTMLALKVVREMRRALVVAFGTTDDDKMAVTVDDALAALSRLCLLIYQVRGTAITRLPSPDARQAAILNALGTPLPGSRSLHMM